MQCLGRTEDRKRRSLSDIVLRRIYGQNTLVSQGIHTKRPFCPGYVVDTGDQASSPSSRTCRTKKELAGSIPDLIHTSSFRSIHKPSPSLTVFRF